MHGSDCGCSILHGEAVFMPESDISATDIRFSNARRLLGEGRRTEALRALTDFESLMASFQNPASTADSVFEWYAIWDLFSPTSNELDVEGRMWRDFARRNRHHFGRPRLEPWRVLFQAAMDHADDSAVTRAAEAYEAAGKRTWAWLRWLDRPRRWAEDPCLGLWVGPGKSVDGLA